MPNPPTSLLVSVRGRRVSRDNALDTIADQGQAVADRLHACIADLQNLRDRMLTHIDEMGGDREHNWELQSDLAHALTAIHTASYKSRTVARHALTGKDRPVSP